MACPNFVEKTFVDGSKTAKFMNVSPSKVFCYMVYALKNMSIASLSVHGETIQYSAVDSSTTSDGKSPTAKPIWYSWPYKPTVLETAYTNPVQQYKVRGGFQVPHLYANRLQAKKKIITCYIKIDM